ncbi:MAG: DNA polymerase III subunit delta [Candidatus Edwardsbacteria bacterium]
MPSKNAYSQLREEISQRKFYSVYLLSGEEEFLKEESLQLLCENLIPKTSWGFNREILYGTETKADEIIDKLSSLAFLAERRIIIVRDFNRLLEKEKILNYLETTSSLTNVLVLVTPKIDFRTKFYKALAEKVHSLVFWPPFEDEIPDWIRRQVEKQEKKITPKASKLLQKSVGRNLADLKNEIDKLVIYTGERRTIEQTDVEKVVGLSKNKTAFDLAWTMGNQEKKQALVLLYQLLQCDEEPLMILNTLTYHYLCLWKIKLLCLRNESKDSIREKTKINKMYFPNYFYQAQRIKEEDIKQALFLLHQTDLNLKEGRGEEQFLLEKLVYQICKNG